VRFFSRKREILTSDSIFGWKNCPKPEVGEARVAVETDVVAHYGFPLGKISECGGEYWVGR